MKLWRRICSRYSSVRPRDYSPIRYALTFQSALLFCSSWWVAESCHNRHFSSSLSALLSPCRLRGCSVWGSLPPKLFVPEASPRGSGTHKQTSWTGSSLSSALHPRRDSSGASGTTTALSLHTCTFFFTLGSSGCGKNSLLGENYFPACFSSSDFRGDINLEWVFFADRGDRWVFSRVICSFLAPTRLMPLA